MADAKPVEQKPAEQQPEKKVPEKPKEPEEDATDESRTNNSDVTFDSFDSTVNTLFSNEGRVVSSLNTGGFGHLLAGARSTAGLTGGRHMFEVRILEAHGAAQAGVAPHQQAPTTKPHLRIGLTTAGSSLFVGDGSANQVSFDSEGWMQSGGPKKKVTQTPLRVGSVCAVVVNLDSASPCANTVSIFRDGVRACEPITIPEGMQGKAVFPTLTFRNVTLQVNDGPTPLVALPFKCHMLSTASSVDCQVAPKGVAAERELIVPVGLPDQGFFDWVDGFVAKNPSHVELSDRKIVDWATKSGLARPKVTPLNSLDSPDIKFAAPGMDEISVKRMLLQLASTTRRSFIVPELRANLIAEERAQLLKAFPSGFRKVAHVVMGEPTAEYKAEVQELIIAEKREAALKKRQAEKRAKALEEHRKKIMEARKAAGKPAEEAAAEEPNAEEEEDEIMVELTDEEKAMTHRKLATPDIVESALSRCYTKFSLPTQADGFDEVVFQWQDGAKSKETLAKWIYDKKLTQRIEDIQPGQSFKDAMVDFGKTLAKWRKQQVEWNDPAKKKAFLAARLAKRKADGEEEATGEPDIDASDLDVSSVEDVEDLGNGEALFAGFAFEDWHLLSARFELHLMVTSFQKDTTDSDRSAFTEKDLGFYYSKYFKKPWNLRSFAVEKLEKLADYVKDTIKIEKDTGFIQTLHGEDATILTFVKLAESHRRERARRLDAGDESAELRFPRSVGVQPGQPQLRLPGQQVVAPTALRQAPFARPHQPPMAPRPGMQVRPHQPSVMPPAGFKRAAPAPQQNYVAKQPRTGGAFGTFGRY